MIAGSRTSGFTQFDGTQYPHNVFSHPRLYGSLADNEEVAGIYYPDFDQGGSPYRETFKRHSSL